MRLTELKVSYKTRYKTIYIKLLHVKQHYHRCLSEKIFEIGVHIFESRRVIAVTKTILNQYTSIVFGRERNVIWHLALIPKFVLHD